jgi:hypothetical protein
VRTLNRRGGGSGALMAFRALIALPLTE